MLSAKEAESVGEIRECGHDFMFKNVSCLGFLEREGPKKCIAKTVLLYVFVNEHGRIKYTSFHM